MPGFLDSSPSQQKTRWSELFGDLHSSIIQIRYCRLVNSSEKKIEVLWSPLIFMIPVLQNDSQWAEEKFKEIAEAYEALLGENRSSLAESEQRTADSFKCAGCGKTLKNRHAYKCHLQLYPGHRWRDTFKDLGMKDLSTFDPLRPPLNQWMSAGDLLTRIFVRVLKPDIAVVWVRYYKAGMEKCESYECAQAESYLLFSFCFS